MICRLLIVLLLFIFKSVDCPLVAVEVSIEQNDISESLPKKVPLRSGVTPLPSMQNGIPKGKAKSSTQLSDQKQDDHKTGKTYDDSCTLQNKEIKEILGNIYKESISELNNIRHYVGFGILIAIFFMCIHSRQRNFNFKNKTLILFTSFFSIVSQLFNYIGCTYLLWKSEALMEEKQGLITDYSATKGNSECLWNAAHGTLLFAVILFCILSYQYLFYIAPPNNKKIKHTKR